MGLLGETLRPEGGVSVLELLPAVVTTGIICLTVTIVANSDDFGHRFRSRPVAQALIAARRHALMGDGGAGSGGRFLALELRAPCRCYGDASFGCHPPGPVAIALKI